MIVGHDDAVAQFAGAWERRKLHHAWLLSGPRGVGKASFAKAAATRILADAAGPRADLPGLQTPPDHPIARLIQAGSHPDFRWVERLENPKKPGVFFRNITVEQVRALGDLLDMTPALSDWRAVVIDSADDMERPAANALLKMLEEPPSNCVFLLVAHSAGRLLPTIRSRCRRLEFGKLDDDAMTSILGETMPETSVGERKRIIGLADGSAGRAMAVAELKLAPLEEAAMSILRQGDPTNGRRSSLALELGKKGSADRYAAFVELIPSLVAGEARQLDGAHRERALDAYAQARELAVLAPRLSLDPSATIFQLGGILASVAPQLP
jgi:DNA polymerase-3 subunit delta'